MNAAFSHGIDDSFVQSYVDYYASVNPWMSLWDATPANTVLLSERDSPYRGFTESEFYVDWLAPQRNVDAFAGTKIEVDEHNTVVVAWHYAASEAETYDRPAARLLSRIAPVIAETVMGGGLLREGIERGMRLGPLLENIDGAALLVDRDRRIHEANGAAAVALRKATLLSGACNVLAMRDPVAQRWLEETVAKLADGQPVASTATAFSSDDMVFSITVTRAPDHMEAGIALLVRPRPRVLVVVRLLAGGPVRVDAAALRLAYGLSRAEIHLCETLLNGRSLADAAQILGVSEGTVRQRVKVVFQKTRTHRQGELIALLARFGTGGWSDEDATG